MRKHSVDTNGKTHTITEWSRIERLPTMSFKTLDLSGSKIKRLPANIQTGSLDLHWTKNLVELPDDLQAEELDIRESRVQRFGKNPAIKTLVTDKSVITDDLINIKRIKLSDGESFDLTNLKTQELMLSLKDRGNHKLINSNAEFTNVQIPNYVWMTKLLIESSNIGELFYTTFNPNSSTRSGTAKHQLALGSGVYGDH